ncbi:MAG: hypothetical protein KGD63_05365 [Candidatus Lokiarchaeota archaeon]|nr:hypothetical protein [Candidatus Lokiarchaeota archaeon]
MIGQIDLVRGIGVFIVQGIIILFFLIIFLKIIKRQRNRYSLLISMVYFLIAIGFSFNIIYVFLTNELTIITLDFFMIYIILVGQVFALLFNLNLLKTIQIFTLKKQRIVFIAYLIAIFLALYFPMDTIITLEYIPSYSWTKFIVIIIFYTLALLVPIIYTIILVNRTMESNELKRRWKFYLIGYILLGISLYNGFLYVTWDNELYRSIITYILVVVTIVGGYLIYYGVGKSLKK